MSGFQLPFSSSLPSTPASEYTHIQRKSKQNLLNYGENPSTTPAGPPPSSAVSLTPVDPPPSHLRSSLNRPAGGLFKNTSKNMDRSSQRGGKLMTSTQGRAVLGKSLSSGSQPIQPGRRLQGHDVEEEDLEEEDLEKEMDDDLDEDFEEDSNENSDDSSEDDLDDELEENGEDEDDDDDKDDDEDEDGQFEPELPSNSHQPDGQAYLSHAHPLRWKSVNTMSEFGKSEQSIRSSIGRGPGIRPDRYETRSISKRSQLQVDDRIDSTIPNLARNLFKQLSQSKLKNPDALILETEWRLQRLYARSVDESGDNVLDSAAENVPEALCKLWQSCCHRPKSQSSNERNPDRIGPPEEDPTQRATFLATLLLKLHHPPTAKGRQVLPGSLSSSMFAKSPHPVTRPRLEPYPKVLLDWLDEHHNPYQTALMDLQSHYPNPVVHSHYWDIIFSSVLRGKLRKVVEILSESDFNLDTLNPSGGHDIPGYQGQQLTKVQMAMNRAIQVLESAPAMIDADWNVVGADWTLFRKRAEQAEEELDVLAAHSHTVNDADDFEATNFGVQSTRTPRADSKLPWEIHLHLKELYGILLGATVEIISSAQDWVEATLGLTIWWPGDDEEIMDIAVTSLTETKKALRRSQSRLKRQVDSDPTLAYQTRLRRACLRVTSANEEEAFQINSLDAVEVGLAAIFEGNVEAVLAFLYKWCMPIASAMMEVSTLEGWYSTPAGNRWMDDFDDDDLMVLTYGQHDRALTRDGLLIEYTEYLIDIAQHGYFQAPVGSSVEAWELAIRVLNRLSDTSLRTRKIGELLGQLAVDSDQRADKIIDLCRIFGLQQQACDTAVTYASSIAEGSHDYGTALKYYARGHDSKKVKDVLDFLTSYSLVQSMAYPPVEQLDVFLADLLHDPRTTVASIAMVDLEAANILQVYVGGYATMRQFYEIRDNDEVEKPRWRPLARKTAAATTLLTVIASASDSIRGGLYDPTSDAVMQVDGLLALLGEALVFIDQPTRFLKLAQIVALLSAIEDLETVHSRIYIQCNDFLQSTLVAARKQDADPPRDLLKKSVSSMTASSTFSLVGSSMLEASIDSDAIPQSRRQPQQRRQRRWDWRSALHDNATGKDLIAILRLGLAKEVAKAWMDGE